MAEFSNYPNQIDTTTELPKATDNVTPVKAELFNRLRDAIIAIEQELGIQPSSTFSTVKARLDALEAGLGGGAIIIPGTISKIRVYPSSFVSGAAVNVPQIIIWNTISSLITNQNANLTGSNTQIVTTKNGTYAVDGQLTIEPTAGVIGGVTINVMRNGSAVHTIADSGTTWGIGIARSFSFSFKTELTSSDTISVEWIHKGNTGSATKLNAGDQFSWLSFIKL